MEKIKDSWNNSLVLFISYRENIILTHSYCERKEKEMTFLIMQ